MCSSDPETPDSSVVVFFEESMSQRRSKLSLFVKKISIYLYITPNKINFKGTYFFEKQEGQPAHAGLSTSVDTKSRKNYKKCGVTKF